MVDLTIDGADGWVSLEVSPLLAYDTPCTIAQAKELHARAGRPNLFAVDLQREGAKAFVDSWNELMAGLTAKSETLKKAG
jgi:hypothetical protein